MSNQHVARLRRVMAHHAWKLKVLGAEMKRETHKKYFLLKNE